MILVRAWQAVEAFFDYVEHNYLPKWLRWEYIGDPVSWYFSHPIIVVLGALIGAALSLVWPWANALRGALVVACIYTFVREPIAAFLGYQQEGWDGAFRRVLRNPTSLPRAIQVGWVVDGIGDVVGVWLTVLLIWWVV